MTSRVLDELRALLLGDKGSPYARYGAPEPELILELLSLLPQPLVHDAFSYLSSPLLMWGLSNIRNKAQRAHLLTILAKLLSDSPEAERKEMLERWFERLPELVDFIPKAMLGEALEVALRMHAIDQVIVLSKLVPRLPETKRDTMLARAVLKEAIELVRSIDSDHERAQAAVKVVPLLEEPLRSEAVKETLNAIRNFWPGERAPELLTDLAPHLPKHLIQTALEMTEELQNDARLKALAGLAPHLAEPLRTRTLETFWVLLQHCLQLEARVRTELDEELINRIGEMAEQLPEPLRNNALIKVLSATEAISYEEKKARDLIVLASYLPKELSVEALAVAQTISEKWWRVRVLSALYPILPNEEQKTIADEVEVISSRRLRQLLKQLPEGELKKLLENVLYQFMYLYAPRREEQLAAEPLTVEPLLEKAPPTKPPPYSSQERIVNTGFSSQTQAEEPLDPSVALAPGQSYYFWFEVGPPIPEAIEVKPEPLEIEFLPSDARLKVALFAYKDEIEITSGSDIGEIQVMPNGKVRVVRQVIRPNNIHSGSELLKRRLFFPVNTPNKEGIFRLRCNIYYEQILVRSQLIKVSVSSDPQPSAIPALQSTTEYTISKSINPNYLVRMKSQKLSFMLNNNGDTHCFRLFGEQDYKSDAIFNALELKTLIDKARGALRYASWEDEGPWTKDKHYRYKGKCNKHQLKADLIRFARRGFRFYTGLTAKIAPGIPKVEEMEKLTLKPTILEFVIRDKTEAANCMFPTTMIYDYPLDTSLALEEYTLCPSFLEALEDENPLEDARCFNGDCPNRDDDSVICPSGFWGFRHSIGMPLGSASEINHKMMYKQSPELTVAVFPSFTEWPQHKQTLKKRIKSVVWNFADTRFDTLASLKHTNPHVVYFYCHGGLKGSIPYIKVGKKNEMGITPDNLFNWRIWWVSPQPLIFINGCHTTALEPKMALNFVTGFIKIHNAAGVIGTEITIFEPLARAFAEECLHRFLVEGKTIGDAVRETRLKLLKEGNPLGLVYNLYANASLRLKKAS